jgi:hypothetical protein
MASPVRDARRAAAQGSEPRLPSRWLPPSGAGAVRGAAHPPARDAVVHPGSEPPTMTLRSSWKIARSLTTPGSPSPCSHVIAPAVVLGRSAAAVRQPLAPPLRPIQGFASDWRATTMVPLPLGREPGSARSQAAIGLVRRAPTKRPTRPRRARLVSRARASASVAAAPEGDQVGKAAVRLWPGCRSPHQLRPETRSSPVAGRTRRPANRRAA